jgi:hypothetical protein
MTQDIQKVMARIKKLLSLANNNPSEEEASTAASMAQKIMKKYNLEMADVIAMEVEEDPSTLVADIVHDLNYDKKIPTWYNLLATQVSTLMNCGSRIECYPNPEDRSKSKIGYSLFGYKHDVEVAKWLFGYLHEQIQSMADTAWKKKMLNDTKLTGVEMKYSASARRGFKDEYRKGVVVGISKRLNSVYGENEPVAVTSSGTSLVLVKDRAIKEKYGDVFNTKPFKVKLDSAGFSSGIQDSSKVKINRIVNSEETQNLRIEK